MKEYEDVMLSNTLNLGRADARLEIAETAEADGIDEQAAAVEIVARLNVRLNAIHVAAQNLIDALQAPDTEVM